MFSFIYRLKNPIWAETYVVSGIKVSAVYNPEKGQSEDFAREFNLQSYSAGFSDFLNEVDAVYIASPHLTHYEYAKQALYAGKHVLCEIPFMLSASQAKELYEYAEDNNLVLLEASKTAFCPSFNHLVTLVKSGIIGEVVAAMNVWCLFVLALRFFLLI